MRAVARALVARTKSNVEPIYKKQPKLVLGALALLAGVLWLAGQSAGGAGAGGAAGDIGICWLRTGINASNAAHELSAVAVAAALLRRYDPTTARCLYVDIDAEKTRTVLDALAKRLSEKPDLIPRVLPAPRLPAKRLAPAIAAFDEDAGRRLASRASRILAMAAPPFGSTLFLDDDALPCARHASETLKQMSKAAASADVDVALASGAHARGAFGAGGAGAAASSAAAAAAARCAVACGAIEMNGDDGDDGGFDRDAPGACDACQLAARAAARDRCAGLSAAPRTGAIFARRTEGTAAFAKDWLAALLDSSPKSRRPQDVGRSAPALAALLAQTCGGVNATRTKKPPAWQLGRLPAAWDVSASQESAAAVRGGFVVLHAAHITTLVEPPERALRVAHSACRTALNGTTAWRLVAAPNGAAARDLAKLSCTEDADGLVITGVPGGGADGGRHAVDVARSAAGRAFELLWARTRSPDCPPPEDTSFPGLVKHPSVT
jgi:hypothetical protein